MKDGLIWMWEANGVYSVKFMYVVVNFGGISLLILKYPQNPFLSLVDVPQ
jgi:hypothetical protein